jgi:serine/threonine protein kinase
MHLNGFCHRDLKPENVLLLDAKDMASAMLIDFGFAAKFYDKKTNERIRFKGFVGTPTY